MDVCKKKQVMHLICFLPQMETWKKPEPQMGFKPSNLRDLVLQPLSYWRLWQARVKCGFLTRTASCSHIVKPGLTTMHSSCTHHQNSKTHGQQQQCIISSNVFCQRMNYSDVLLMILLLHHLMPYNDRCLIAAPLTDKTYTMFKSVQLLSLHKQITMWSATT